MSRAHEMIRRVTEGESPASVVESSTKVLMIQVPDTITGKVIYASGTKVAYLDKQQIRVNFDRHGSSVLAEIIPSHGAVIRTAILDELSHYNGLTKIRMVWDLQMIIVEM